MGTDIIAYIEVGTDYGSRKVVFGELSLARDYTLFAFMAGVRAEPGWEPVAEPRGLPDDVSLEVVLGSLLYIDDALGALNADRFCTREQAESWVESGLSEFSGRHGIEAVTTPYRHSISWLDLDELDEVQRRYRGLVGSEHREFTALIAAMRTLESPGAPAPRLVFWFD